jgi:hypothetical protein
MTEEKRKSRRSRWVAPTTAEDNSALQSLATALLEIEFKALKRPAYVPQSGRSEKEVRWALRVFTCSSCSLFRDMLRSYLTVRDQKLEAASFLTVRLMFEVVAMGNYLRESIVLLLKNARLDRVWDVLYRANIGSYYILQSGHTPQGAEPNIPLKIGKAVSSLNKLTPGRPSGWAEREYSFLSEFSHPDAFALMHYSEMNGHSETVAFHTQPEADVGYLRDVVGATVGLFGIVYRRLFALAQLHTAHKLLERAIKAFLVAEEKRNNGRKDP